MHEEKSMRAGKQLPDKKTRVYSTKYAAVHNREWRKDHPNNCSITLCKEPKVKGSMCEKHKKYYYQIQRTQDEKRKIRVLTHYGPSGVLRCCWVDCSVVDSDMLSIDHVNNDGATARKTGYNGCGTGLYRTLEKLDYPEGYQTLCHNHQWKKEIMRRRSLRAQGE
jgi:hypothetical protein